MKLTVAIPQGIAIAAALVACNDDPTVNLIVTGGADGGDTGGGSADAGPGGATDANLGDINFPDDLGGGTDATADAGGSDTTTSDTISPPDAGGQDTTGEDAISTDAGGGDTTTGDTGGTDDVRTRLADAFRLLCTRAQTCEPEYFAEYFDSAEECFEQYLGYIDEIIADYSEQCVSLSADFYACYGASSCEDNLDSACTAEIEALNVAGCYE